MCAYAYMWKSEDSLGCCSCPFYEPATLGLELAFWVGWPAGSPNLAASASPVLELQVFVTS